jgi:uncharacterized protein YvpB
MKLFGKVAVYTLSLMLSVGLVFASGVFGVLLYAKASGREWLSGSRTEKPTMVAPASPVPTAAAPQQTPAPQPTKEPKKASVLLDAPAIRQYPELPAGCEITSLAMLLQFYGVDRSKLDLADEMRIDQTAITWGLGGKIASWGNPNLGFVGNIYGKSRGFGIYHTALFPLMQKYVSSAADVTGSDFATLEQQLSDGFPVVAWTTIDFAVPTEWVEWDTSIGPIRTTFKEHAVLLVGYDDQYVYANDPYNGKKASRIDKEAFVASWTAMGKQALTYTKTKE